MLSIIIPTITGREESYKRCQQAYLNTMPHDWEIVTVTDRPNWPAACNEGFTYANGDYLHFTADDLEPLPGWWEEALDWITKHDELPAPKVFNYSAQGEWDNAVDGPDKAVPHFTRIPLMTRSQYERIGPWPEIDYCADVWLSEKARTLGIETRMIHSYAFVHHWEQIGRISTPERLAQSERQLQELRAAL
jgi:GT2 family glycosyltransferase